MKLVTLTPNDKELCQQAAQVLVAAFAQHYPGDWDTLEEAQEEVTECLAPEMILRGAVDTEGKLLGWIGGRPEYEGIVWEMHPLAVDPSAQGQGVGRALVADLEEQARRKGGLTITLGADDVSGQTSLGGVDVYPDPLTKLINIQNLNRHQFEFYQKCGYTITGIMPDANGYGKPDIYMAKRIGDKP